MNQRSGTASTSAVPARAPTAASEATVAAIVRVVVRVDALRSTHLSGARASAAGADFHIAASIAACPAVSGVASQIDAAIPTTDKRGRDRARRAAHDPVAKYRLLGTALAGAWGAPTCVVVTDLALAALSSARPAIVMVGGEVDTSTITGGLPDLAGRSSVESSE